MQKKSVIFNTSYVKHRMYIYFTSRAEYTYMVYMIYTYRTYAGTSHYEEWHQKLYLN